MENQGLPRAMVLGIVGLIFIVLFGSSMFKTIEPGEKGVIFRLIKKDNSIEYKYAPINLNHKQVKKWIKKQEKLIKKEDPNYKIYSTYEPLFWYLKNYSCIEIYRNYDWINDNIVTFMKVWNKICYYKKKNRYKTLIQQKSPYKPKYKKKTKYEEKQCLIDSDSDD